MTVITAEQIGLYQSLGILLVRNLMPAHELNIIERECAAIVSLGVTSGAAFYWEADHCHLIRRIEALSEVSGPLRCLLHSGTVATAIEQLVGETVTLFKDKLNLKEAGGNGFAAHIDGHFLWTDQYGRERRGWAEYADWFVNATIPLDTANERNGCLEVGTLRDTKSLLGTEFDQIVSRLDGRGPGLTEAQEGTISFHSLAMEPGDVAFFDWRVPHRSGPNRSAHCRRILYTTYNRAAVGDHYRAYYSAKAASRNSERAKSSI